MNPHGASSGSLRAPVLFNSRSGSTAHKLLCPWRWPVLESLHELRDLAAEHGVAVGHERQRVEFVGLRKLFGFGDACDQFIPRQHPFHGGEQIGILSLGVDQRPPSALVALQRFVDGFAVFRKSAQMSSLRLLNYWPN